MKQYVWSKIPYLTYSILVLQAIGVLLLFSTVDAGEATSKDADSVDNPHIKPFKCVSCHISSDNNREDIRFNGDVIKLCQSCHNGRNARIEGHPTGIKPTAKMAKNIPAYFPLKKGVLDCLSCHDISGHCQSETNGPLNRYFLRNYRRAGSSLSFCFLCHNQGNFTPFNVHDQLKDGKIKVDTCIWCHPINASKNIQSTDGAFSKILGKSHEVCDNCHRVKKNHPVDTPHMNLKPSSEMMSYISAYELRDRMVTPFPKLLKYVRAAKRPPESIPFDEEGKITCYTCHNPHEDGVLPKRHPRAIGAEPKKVLHHRFRAREGNICIVCHDK